MRNLQKARADVDGLKPVTTEIASIMLRGGLVAINGAIAGAKQPWYRPDLPGNTRRSDVLGKLRWHVDNLRKFEESSKIVYPQAADLKKWVLEAFVEANAVEEGAAYLDTAWKKMWDEIAEALRRVPKEILKAAGVGFSALVEAATGIPLWGWGLILTGTAAAVGTTIYLAKRTK